MMRTNTMQVSMDTLIAASPLMGHQLEDRSSISEYQDAELTHEIINHTSTALRAPSQRDLFCVAPLDILVSEQNGRKQFHLLELNGTGIGGVTNLPTRSVMAILKSLAESSRMFDPGVVLLAISGKESEKSPRLNRLLHEKLLFTDAIRAGLAAEYGHCGVANINQLTNRCCVDAGTPTVVPGYMKDLLNNISLADDGSLWMQDQRVTGAVNDRFCRNLLQRFGDRVDLNQLQTLNRCFAAGSDKGVAYSLMNDYVRREPRASLPDQVLYTHAHHREELIDTVLQWLSLGRQVVIKPHGTGLGHGIEFFFSASESRQAIIDKIDGSLTQTAEYYGMPGGALPYTVCEYVDACRVQAPGHELNGHKYELRVVVYREKGRLRAMPSIAKVARERETAGVFERRALINNITASGDTQKVCGTDYMLPLCNRRTLEMLDLSQADLEDLCSAATGYVRHVLDQLEDQPGRFGLPGLGAQSLRGNLPADLIQMPAPIELARAA